MDTNKQIGGNHYSSQEIQPWEYMESVMAKVEFEGFLRGNIIKYIGRYDKKDGVRDLEKAQHYLDKLIEHKRQVY